MKHIFICANYSGLEENYFKALNYCKYVANKGCIPLNTITMYHGTLNENITEERKIISEASKALINICDEVWVFGKCADTLIADVVGCRKPVIYVKDNFTLNDKSEVLSVIMREFESQTGRTVNRSILDSVLYYLNQGFSRELIIAAIKKTGKINAGWNYTEGILRNCLKRGITTVEAFSKQVAPQKEENNFAAYNLDLFEKMLRSKD